MRLFPIFLSLSFIAVGSAAFGQKTPKAEKTPKNRPLAAEAPLPPPPPASLEDSIAYAIGLDLARNFLQYQADVNPDLLRKGMNDQHAARSGLDPETVQQLLFRFQEEVNDRMEAAKPQPVGPISMGMMAPDLALPNPEGDTIRLSDLRGKYVLIDFWASWCKPCRIENPNVVRMYNQYKNKGFEILGVSLDGTRDAWVKAIEQDGLTWPHMSDLKLWRSEAAQIYSVNAIPHTVLVDPAGKVAAVNLRGASLEAKLAELLK